MGLLTLGKALDWNESEKHLNSVKEKGIEYFISVYNKYKEVTNPNFLWGDEIELTVLKKINGRYKVSHNGYKIIERYENLIRKTGNDCPPCRLLPEYGSFMVETTPSKPYRGNTCDLLLVEKNMRLRRLLVSALSESNEEIFSIANFPLLGTKDYCYPSVSPGGPFSESEYISDQSINPHPRFRNLTRNIRIRRGSKVAIKVPIFKDKNTQKDKDFIEMDAMAFGMGCSCLQVTLQAQNMQLSRFLYDQFVPLSPIFLALTASTPFHKGLISDWDVRWNIISQSVDCRNEAERGKKPLKFKQKHIPKSRFSPVSCYLALYDEEKNKIYNKVNLTVDEDHYKKLRNGGVDDLMAKHIAHLFIRDPLVVFEDNIAEKASSDHFENIQSTNWQTCRLKPPMDDSVGWRVELRSMEIQLTEFENAAFTVFAILLSRAILFFEIEFYLPIDLVNKNMETSHRRDACINEKFYFRSNSNSEKDSDKKKFSENDECEKMSIDQIINGNGKFKGLISIVYDYIESIDCDERSIEDISKYLDLVSKRANGELVTAARWLRNIAMSSKFYGQNSVLTPLLCSEIFSKIKSLSDGNLAVPELLGNKNRVKGPKQLFDEIYFKVKDRPLLDMLMKSNVNRGNSEEECERTCIKF